MAELIKKINKRVVIEGHASHFHTRSQHFPTEWELTSLRSIKMLRYFVQKHDIPAQNLVSAAYGSQKPLVPKESRQATLKNNRVDLHILLDEDVL